MSNFKWISKNREQCIVTLYENNITLNKGASSYFENAYSVMLGVDFDSYRFAIRPISKEEYELGHIPHENIYKISLRSSYSRISNKKFVSELAKLIKIDFSEKHIYKFDAEWDNENKILIVNLNNMEVE